MRFFVGLDRPGQAARFERAFISRNTLRRRGADFEANEWIMDSGAFTTIAKHGGYPEPPAAYAAAIRRWSACGNLLAAVAEDFMCEPHVIERTGLSRIEHQRLTIVRYDALVGEDPGVYILPVLQGFAAADYVEHVRAYGDRLPPGAWVGVGSICKRNGNPRAIEEVLLAIMRERPDLRLHGFGLKLTALASSLVRSLLHSADSMAWSYSGRRARGEGDKTRNGHDWQEAKRWIAKLEAKTKQTAWQFL